MTVAAASQGSPNYLEMLQVEPGMAWEESPRTRQRPGNKVPHSPCEAPLVGESPGLGSLGLPTWRVLEGIIKLAQVGDQAKPLRFGHRSHFSAGEDRRDP